MIGHLLIALAAPQPQDQPSHTPAPTYHVRLTVDPSTQSVVGHARLFGIAAPFELAFSQGYAFKTLEPRLLGELTLSAGGATLDPKRVSPFAWHLEAAPSGPVEITWAIKLDHRDHPEVALASDGYEQPYLEDDHGMLFTAAVVPIPRPLGATSEAAPPKVTVEFDVPDHWSIHAPWPETDPDDGATAKAPPARTYFPGMGGLRDDIVLLGNWRVNQVQAGDLQATFGFAPGEEWLEPLVQKHLGPIIKAEIALFGGAPQPSYLFVFGAAGDMRGYGGSPKTNSMTLFVGDGLPKDQLASGVSHLVAHEFHHTWMRANCHPEDDLRYIAEGFTDYYAYVVSWRLGYMTGPEFKRTLEDKLSEGARALTKYGRSLTAAGGPEFFLGRHAYDSCYAAGLTMALWTDLALRQSEQPRTLDDLMRAFYPAKTWDDGTKPAMSHWEALLTRWLGEDLSRAHVDAAQAIGGMDVPSLFATIGTPIETEHRSAGTSPRANFDGTTLRQLDPAGPAALAGLHARDRLLSVNGVNVTDEATVRNAWSSPVDGQLILTFERDKAKRTLTVPVPTTTHYTLPPSTLKSLAH